MKFKFFLISVLFLVAKVQSQDILGKKERNKVRLQGEKFFDKGDYLNALEKYSILLSSDSLNPEWNYHVGVCKFHLKNYRHEALNYFKKCDSRINTEYHYYFGVLNHLAGNFDIARAELEIYIAMKADREQDDAWILQLIDNIFTAQNLMNRPINVEVKNLGAIINTKYSEYVPLISADGKELFFTARKPGEKFQSKDIYGQYYEDIYYSKNINGAWSLPELLPTSINTEAHDACVSLTPEGENLLIYRTSSSVINGFIYSVTFDGTTWSDLSILEGNVNRDNSLEASACYSPSGHMIIFSSNRSGGFGGKDLYKIVKLPNGKWSEAQNLGATINTPFDEDAPFIHSNGRQLYFSSQGHNNMGGFDVFVSEFDESGKFSQAKNMGYPINTVGDDIYFVLNGSETIGYYSSDREGGFGETDLYELCFLQNSSNKVNTAYVVNPQNKPCSAKITLINTTTNTIAGIYKSNPKTGKFILLSDDNHEYSIIVESDGYYKYVESIILTNDDFKIVLTPIINE